MTEEPKRARAKPRGQDHLRPSNPNKETGRKEGTVVISPFSRESREELCFDILMAAQTGLSMMDVANKHRVSRPTIYNYRKAMAAMGYDILDAGRTEEQAREAAKAYIDLSKPRTQFTGLASQDAKPPPHIAKPKERLSAQERLKLLAKLAQDQNIAPTALINAVRTLDDLEQRNRPPETYGPPAPLTEEEVISRMARLMKAQGREASMAALALCEEHKWTDSYSLSGKTPTTAQVQMGSQTPSAETLSQPSPSSQDGSSASSSEKTASQPSTSPMTQTPYQMTTSLETTGSPGPSSEGSGG